MSQLSYEAGLAEGALRERERLRQVALMYLKAGQGRYVGGSKNIRISDRRIMERLFGQEWDK